jgi:tRNA 2-thiouridine synthesizing protein A
MEAKPEAIKVKPDEPFHRQQVDDDGKTFAVNFHLDTRGMTCPMPALKSLEKSKSMSAGEILEVVGDWPGSKFEVPYAVADKPGLEVVRIIESDIPDDEMWWIYIRRS